ncbi:DNA replication protein DnaC, partial [Staphylococcus aureus]
MQSLGSLARNIKPNQNIVEEEHNLKCERCGNTYDYYKFSNGKEFRHGCDCSMIQAGKEAEQQRKQKYLNRIFNQSNVNASL